MWQLDDLDNKEEVQGDLVIKGFYQYKWPTFHSCHYCIDAMKQYNCVAKYRLLYTAMLQDIIHLQGMCCIIISI